MGTVGSGKSIWAFPCHLIYQIGQKRLADWSNKYVQAITPTTNYNILLSIDTLRTFIIMTLLMLGNKVEEMKIIQSISMIIVKIEMNKKR